MKLLLFAATFGFASAFNASLERRAPSRYTLLRASQMEQFERAVECAENFGYCNLDELEALSADLEEYNGNFFEHSTDEEVLAKEVGDRKDVADILKLQSELRLRMNYLEDANLFAEDVHKETERFPEQAW
uniref:Uncharacterized protein n=1 Tax=Minutocellus polymorphus TaxID=265543 RepID=A0A7S0FQP5_9STRA|mmetsp:Transcript_4664/g.7922  ORF Transcript_4664/g.7922 Transcript_4664/m.7922 type:complete len:131 (+) Transcript_4664:89-481(+)|eukprot:CAMPEP_0197715482 /NCGR_PEP_ID=MMETSP1434-20131217/625_1 /TAXON_ID=265543 /ORGANISM="Minutocellus polymorphus, Strain CCMP3303" /LENGTH=130 /DNA_ID=CAMNT_0043299595 /DNA_START=80 /DNA_END=469 /DNA_ORIENTATION=-